MKIRQSGFNRGLVGRCRTGRQWPKAAGSLAHRQSSGKMYYQPQTATGSDTKERWAHGESLPRLPIGGEGWSAAGDDESRRVGFELSATTFWRSSDTEKWLGSPLVSL